MPGLDGLRAIAVIGIIIYHLNKQWLTGGFRRRYFFVISGYLITSLLLKEYEDTGTINLKIFGFVVLKVITSGICINSSSWNCNFIIAPRTYCKS